MASTRDILQGGTVSNPLPVGYFVFVSWNTVGWQTEPDWLGEYDDISEYVEDWHIVDGKDSEAGNYVASTLDLILKNESKIFTPTYVPGPLHGLLLPMKQVIFLSSHNDVVYPLFYGYIDQLTVKPHWEAKQAELYCTDGMDVLARQLISQDWNNRMKMTAGAAVGKILDAAGWSPTRRVLDTMGGANLNYPESH
jgi:hypothetical protein